MAPFSSSPPPVAERPQVHAPLLPLLLQAPLRSPPGNRPPFPVQRTVGAINIEEKMRGGGGRRRRSFPVGPVEGGSISAGNE